MNTTAAATVPSLGDIADTADDLIGFHPAIDVIVQQLVQLAAGDHDAETTGDLLQSLAGTSPSVLEMFAALIQRLGDPATNPAIANLPAARRTQVADYTDQFAEHLAYAPTDLINETAAQIEGI